MLFSILCNLFYPVIYNSDKITNLNPPTLSLSPITTTTTLFQQFCYTIFGFDSLYTLIWKYIWQKIYINKKSRFSFSFFFFCCFFFFLVVCLFVLGFLFDFFTSHCEIFLVLIALPHPILLLFLIYFLLLFFQCYLSPSQIHFIVTIFII